MPLRHFPSLPVLVLVSALPLAAQGPRPAPATIAAAVDSLARRVVAAGLTPALGVAVVMDGRTILARGYGLADVTRGIRADGRTLWYLASTSKSFTGFAAALLADAGALSFDAPITTYLPTARWAPGVNPQSLTLAHFLSHTHGLSSGAVVPSAAFTSAVPEARWPSLLVHSTPLESPDLRYSNLGYNVTAMAIDAVRPEGWKRYLETHVYAPAGLRETFARVSGIDPRRIAMPHALGADGRFTTEEFQKTDATMNAAGGHLATLADLARWTLVQMDSGVLDGRRVLPASAVERSHRLLAAHPAGPTRRFALFDREGWGAGWDIGSYERERMVSRFGSYHSTRSHLSFLPGRRIGVVAQSNGGIGSPATDLIAGFAYDLEAGRPDAWARAESRLASLVERRRGAPQQVAASDSVRAARQRVTGARPLAGFAGRFAHDDYGTVEFIVDGAALRYRWGALAGPVERGDAPDRLRFEMAGAGTFIDFSFDTAGRATAVRLQGVTFARTEPAPET